MCKSAQRQSAACCLQAFESWASSSVRAVQGTLKGYDQLLNLVMDETIEYLRGNPAELRTLVNNGSYLYDNLLCLKILKTPSEFLIKLGVLALW